MTLSKILKSAKSLLVVTFRAPKDSTEIASRQSIIHLLQIRTLICHSLIMTTRVVLATFGFAHWLEAFDRDIDVASDAAFEHKIPVTVILVTLLGLGVFLNILCWKKRNMTYIIIHYELVYTSVLTLVPYDYGDLRVFVAFYSTLCIYLYASCSGKSSVSDIVSCTIFTALQAMVCFPLA